MESEQAETIAFLESLAPGCSRVTTHASHVFLFDVRAFKLKRALKYDYLDFSTPERRIADSEREFALNSRFAPHLYLGVRRITRAPDGALGLDGTGEAIDAVVEMKRFPEDALLEEMAERGDLDASLIDRLAGVIARSHEVAEVAPTTDGHERISRVLTINEHAMRETGIASRDRIDRVAVRLRDHLHAHCVLVDARASQGKVRRCHGDLILRNICLFEGEPTLFDALEFDEELATIDVLYDLGFLLMDLWRRGLRVQANRLFNRYFDLRDETDGLPLLPFFMAVRACVRAHVAGALAKDAPERMAEARDYFALAEQLLEPRPARLVALGGFSGSGKSTVSAALAHAIGPAPGGRIHASDRIRKALFGKQPTERLPPEAYQPQVSEEVYRRMREASRATLGAGHAAIAEAVFDRAADRAAIEAVSRECNVSFEGFWLDAPPSVLEERVGARRGDVSDADIAVLRAQLARGNEDVRWRMLDAARSPGEQVSEMTGGRP